MELPTILTIMFTALIMHHLSPTVTAIADHKTPVPNASLAAGFSFRLVSNHAIRRGGDGFLHCSSRLPSSAGVAANATAPHPEMQLPYAVTVTVSTGNGRNEYQLKVDTATSLTWLQYKPCSPSAPQSKPIFDPSASPTFHNVTGTSELCRPPYKPTADGLCSFRLKVIRRGLLPLSVQGLLFVDNFTMDGKPLAYRPFFGCSHSTRRFDNNAGKYAGVFTIGRMPTSLAMQLAAHHRGLARFSYCLVGGGTNRQGFLRFGADVPHHPKGHMTTTRILPALHAGESEYYVGLVGVSLGARRLDAIRPETLARRADGEGGCVVDLGTPATVMVREAYNVVEEAVWSELERHRAERVERRRGGYGLCVRATEAARRRLPSLSLHFAVEKAALVLAPEQLFVTTADDQQGREEQIACLAMEPGRRTIIGAMQQVDTRFVFDLKDSTISFASESCKQDTAQVL
ncbi:hypothetical protein C2845_PM06G28200 [Panicum miliaceum]|uniref:Peptidase A1 domain-containing protein n=1 Tax=Panicum miliaceum TaxID=4540 RepID=A0A3L6RBS0_PANMI|nr:hypothetical protein C2845_PM06G28200 [Panicum miliaceum]